MQNANGTNSVLYGEDGFDVKLKTKSISIGKSNTEINKMFSIACKDAKSCVNSSVYKKLNKDKKKYGQLNDELILKISLKIETFYSKTSTRCYV